MSHSERNKKMLDDFFSNLSLKDKAGAIEFISSLKLRERATRYVRKDVEAIACELFNILFGKDFAVELININSQGALIATPHELSIGNKISLSLQFDDGTRFKIKGAVVNIRGEAPNHQYGIKFSHDYSELGQYLQKPRQAGGYGIPES